MVSRALRIVGLLLLVSGTSAAQWYDGHRQPSQAPSHRPGVSAWAAQQSASAGGLRAREASLPRAKKPSPARAQRRDAAGRAWSDVELGDAGRVRSVDGSTWTTQRLGSWSYSYASDGTSCVSRRTAQTVFISCR